MTRTAAPIPTPVSSPRFAAFGAALLMTVAMLSGVTSLAQASRQDAAVVLAQAAAAHAPRA